MQDLISKTNSSVLQQPFKTYNGGKSGNGTYQTIINNIPRCEVFIDAMVGNGGIVSKILLPELTVINDIDSGIIDAFDTDGHGSIVKENLHFRYLIDKYDCERSKAFFYFDPPYLKSSRKSQSDLYNFEWSVNDHEEFISRVLTVQSNCMISHYPCNLYDQAFQSWRKKEFQSMTRHGLATEAIYMNYEEPQYLQDYSYLGNDYINRQRIKRKIARFVTKLAALPLHERNAIISAVTDKFNHVNNHFK